MESITTALLIVLGTCLYAAAFNAGGDGVGYLALCIIPFVIGSVAMRCMVLGRGFYNYSHNNDGPKWSLFCLGACVTVLALLPITLYRMRLISPMGYTFAVLGTEIQCIAVALSAYGNGFTTTSGQYGDF